MEFRRITMENLFEIVNLKVLPSQEHFLGDNTKSILQAYATVTNGGVALPFGIYVDDIPVGFIMFGYDVQDPDDPKVAAGNYCIWRFMIDATHQGKGYGEQAVKMAINYIRGLVHGENQLLWLCYEPDNIAAQNLYRKIGFIENGEISDGEIVAVYRL